MFFGAIKVSHVSHSVHPNIPDVLSYVTNRGTCFFSATYIVKINNISSLKLKLTKPKALWVNIYLA